MTGRAPSSGSVPDVGSAAGSGVGGGRPRRCPHRDAQRSSVLARADAAIVAGAMVVAIGAYLVPRLAGRVDPPSFVAAFLHGPALALGALAAFRLWLGRAPALGALPRAVVRGGTGSSLQAAIAERRAALGDSERLASILHAAATVLAIAVHGVTLLFVVVAVTGIAGDEPIRTDPPALAIAVAGIGLAIISVAALWRAIGRVRLDAADRARRFRDMMA